MSETLRGGAGGTVQPCGGTTADAGSAVLTVGGNGAAPGSLEWAVGVLSERRHRGREWAFCGGRAVALGEWDHTLPQFTTQEALAIARAYERDPQAEADRRLDVPVRRVLDDQMPQLWMDGFERARAEVFGVLLRAEEKADQEGQRVAEFLLERFDSILRHQAEREVERHADLCAGRALRRIRVQAQRGGGELCFSRARAENGPEVTASIFEEVIGEPVWYEEARGETWENAVEALAAQLEGGRDG